MRIFYRERESMYVLKLNIVAYIKLQYYKCFTRGKLKIQFQQNLKSNREFRDKGAFNYLPQLLITFIEYPLYYLAFDI